MEQRPVPLPPEELADFIDRVLAEDVGPGDETAEATIPENARLKAAFIAREDMVVAGFPLSRGIVERLVPAATIDVLIEDGGKAAAGQTIARVDGPARGLLTAERSALNILQHLSGIATLTHRYVDKIAHTPAQLLDTRKTIPGLRKLEKYAVRMGGGANHRMGLFDAIMIKDNHIAAAGGIREAIRACRSHSKLPITIECDTLDQVAMALEEGVERILLDNMTNDELREAVRMTDGMAELEASGGVRLETIAAIAETGVDCISVGRLTQSAPAVDIGLDFEAA